MCIERSASFYFLCASLHLTHFTGISQARSSHLCCSRRVTCSFRSWAQSTRQSNRSHGHIFHTCRGSLSHYSTIISLWKEQLLASRTLASFATLPLSRLAVISSSRSFASFNLSLQRGTQHSVKGQPPTLSILHRTNNCSKPYSYIRMEYWVRFTLYLPRPPLFTTSTNCLGTSTTRAARTSRV